LLYNPLHALFLDRLLALIGKQFMFIRFYWFCSK
jgi:hypothetical protein